MKRFLIPALLATGLYAQTAPDAAPEAAPAQAPTGSAPAAASPAAAVSPASTGAEGEAASGVPLPNSKVPPADTGKTLPLMPEVAPAPTPSGGHHRKGKGSRSEAPARNAAAPSTTGSSATFATEADIRQRVRLRIATTRAQSDPAIKALWEAAHRTTADPERRAALATYYNQLYDRVTKLDPTDAEKANARRQASLSRMTYRRLGSVDNSEDPFVAPTPPPPGSTEGTGEFGLGQ